MKLVSSLAMWSFASAVAVVVVPSQARAQFGTNLLQNPGAEAGAGSPSGNDVFAVPGWSTTSNFTAVLYGAPGGFPSLLDPGAPTRGANFFAGGPNNGQSAASQTISLGFGSSVINSGFATFDLSGWFGGFVSQNDNAVLTVSFFTAGNGLLSSASIGGVSAADRGSATEMLFRSMLAVAVPTGAEHATIQLLMTRTDGDYNDGYADNLAFRLNDNSPTVSSTPEPASLTLIGTGLAAVAVIRRRRRRRA